MRNKRHPLLAFYIIVSIFYMATGFAHPVTPILIRRLQLEDYMFGLALATMLTSNFLFSPFWGKLSDYLSGRVTLLIGCTGYAVGQVLFALAETRFMFLFARFFAGIFTGAAFVSILIYIVNSTEDKRLRGQYLVTSATIQAVSGSMGYFIGGMLGEIHSSVAVIAQAVTLAACGVAFFLLPSRQVLRPLGREARGRLVREANPFRAFVAGKEFLTVAFVLLFAVCALQSFSQTAFDQSLNYYVIDQLGLSSGHNGLIKAVMGIVTLVANTTLCAYLMRRGDVRRSVSYVLLAATVCITAVLFIKNLTAFLAVNVLYFALSAISVPMTQSLVASADTAADRNLVMGFYNALKSFGGILGALVAGFTYVVSPLTPFICCAAGLMVATLCSLLYRRRTGRAEAGNGK